MGLIQLDQENLKPLIESLRRVTEYRYWYQATWTVQAHILAWVPVLQDPLDFVGPEKENIAIPIRNLKM
jgi:hypothetical protein